MRLPSVLLVLLPSLSGCLGGFGLDPDFGDLTLEFSVEGTAFNRPFEAAGANFTLEMPLQRLEEELIPPTGGGGDEVTLALPDVEHVVRARFRDRVRLADFEVEWTLRNPYSEEVVQTAYLQGDRVFETRIVGAGGFILQAEVGKGLRVDTENRREHIAVNVHWAFESTVHPIKLGEGPYPPNYDEMSDRFRIDPADGYVHVRAETHHRGGAGPAVGDDIDLALRGNDADDCHVAGHSATGRAQANETLVADVPGAPLVLYAGAIPRECAAQPFYHNAGPVPYRLDLWLFYGPR